MVVNGDYFYGIISDGAGCSDYAKDAAWCTVNAAADYCYNNGKEFFTDKRKQAAKCLIFDIQQALYDKAKELGTELSEMKCTLVMLCIDTKTKQYTTVHVGDGLIAKMSDVETEIISYPENGVTKQYTYMVNSSSVMQHLRIKNDCYNNLNSFFLCSDGAMENCYSTHDYIKKIDVIDIYNHFDDDTTYCFINLNYV